MKEEKIEVTCEQLGEILFRFTIEIAKSPLEGFDVSDMSERRKLRLSDEILILEMFAVIYACQQQITNLKINQRILDSYHKYIYDWIKHKGASKEVITSFEEGLQERYKEYYSALHKGLETRKTEMFLWYIGKTAAEYALEESEDPLWTMQFSVKVASTVKATRDLIKKYRVLINKKNDERGD